MKNIIKNIKRIAMIPIMVATLYNCGDFSKKPELSYEQKLKIELQIVWQLILILKKE